ncbi:hypothetical protein [Pseudomonas turukhanskensis]|uniref:Uncharacterized protein n=1 Tax=Pseudomonas turukhanskensis TaxID=1806536 RepID=A0A9W6K359_9PSED|nr:hypothetical protein [Pseudomonas turukhanskensis]GLK87366.1 hypothetical protein GCM10017655_04280 [Pseudomonas turukhanskensis]
MKTSNRVKHKNGTNGWFGLCALSLLPFSSGDLLASVNCPEGQYDNGSGGCSVSDGYSPTDQGSIAQQHLNTYAANKTIFATYQQEWEDWNKKNLQLIEQLNKPLAYQYQLLAARLAKWHKEDTPSFVEYFKQVKTTIPLDIATDLPNDLTSETDRDFMVGFVLDAFVQKVDDFLVSQYNANLQHIARLYFQMNPTIMKSIHINYWTKAYAPSTSGKWGFTNSYSDTMRLRDAQSVYSFIRPADSSDYDFSQVEEDFTDTWNNANTSPSVNTSKTTRYYKFVPQPLPKTFLNDLAKGIDQTLIKRVNRETLADTQSKVVGFKFNRLMRSYLSASQNPKELTTKLVNQIFAYPQPNTITQISRVINQAKKSCLAPAESRVLEGKIDLQHTVKTRDCGSGGRSLDWFVIKNEDKTIQLKNAFSGQCLTAPRQANDGILSMVCGGRVNTFTPAFQNWQWTGDNRLRRSGIDHLYSLTMMGPNDYSNAWGEGRELDTYPYDYLKGKEASRGKWSISIGGMRSEMIEPQNYKTAQQLAQNFFALMYGFTEELPLLDRIKTVNKGTSLPTEDRHSSRLEDAYTSQEKATQFFNQIYSNSSLYNQLPTRMQSFITALRSGTSLLEAYSQHAPDIYDEVRKLSQIKTAFWDNPSNKKGSVQVYENPYNNSVDVFISKFDGNPAGTARWLPINKTSNDNWTYVTSLGSKAQVAKIVERISNHFPEWGAAANYGDIFRYNNPVSKKLEFFQANFKGMANNSAVYFPTNQTSNDKWRYLGQQGSAAVLVAALTNDINTAYYSYLYNLIKINVGTKHTISNIERQVFPLNDNGEDGLDFNNWTQSGSGPSYDIAGQPALGQHFYVASPTLSGISLYNSGNVGAIGALSNALINMKFEILQSNQAELLLQRMLMRTRFEEMFRSNYNDILEGYGLNSANAPPDQLDDWDLAPRDIFRDWSLGDMDPPENFQEFAQDFRALFKPGQEGQDELYRFLDELQEEAPLELENPGLMTLTNSSLSTAFNALTVTETNIALSTVTVNSLTSSFVGLSY